MAWYEVSLHVSPRYGGAFQKRVSTARLSRTVWLQVQVPPARASYRNTEKRKTKKNLLERGHLRHRCAELRVGLPRCFRIRVKRSSRLRISLRQILEPREAATEHGMHFICLCMLMDHMHESELACMVRWYGSPPAQCGRRIRTSAAPRRTSIIVEVYCLLRLPSL